MRRVFTLAMALAFTGAVSAADLDISVESGGSNSVTVGQGETVDWEIVGVLSDDLNEGLALFGLDLSFDGGDLDPTLVNVPTMAPMNAFVAPEGINNPSPVIDPMVTCPPNCGYAGTLQSGDLIQIGGGQNTINNNIGNAPFPIGGVITGVAATTAPQVLVSGSLIAPMADGTYTLSVSNLFANVIREGEDGMPPQNFFKTEAANAGSIANLTITVETGGEPIPVEKWESFADHGTVGEVSLEIPNTDDFTEPRLDGLNKIVVTFASAVDPTTVDSDSLTMSGCTLGDVAVDLSGITKTVSLANGNTEMIVEFSPILPGTGINADPVRYRMDVVDVEGPGGAPIAGDNSSRILYAQLGDVNGDGRVNTTDINGARTIRDQLNGADIDPNEPNQVLRDFMVRADVNTDGRANTTDMNAVRTVRDDAGGNDSTGITCPN